jgi:methylmalonyl-CoA mutase cobalamin-binding subunit
VNQYEKRMLAILREGKAKFGFNSVKAEFEAEGTRVDELLRLLELARRADLKVGLKIGGCEAIRDLIECKQYGVDYVIAPMVETPYALEKYAAAVKKVFTDTDERNDIGFLFNLETITTYRALAEMVPVAKANNLGMVFGRVDFAGSMGKDRDFVDSDAMKAHILDAAKAARDNDLPLVVGGAVSPDSIPVLKDILGVRLDRFETRKVIFAADTALGLPNLAEGLSLAMEFELLWLKNKRDYYSSIAKEDEKRIAMMEARQQKAAY